MWHAVNWTYQSRAALIKCDPSHGLAQLSYQVHNEPLRPRGAAGGVLAVAMQVLRALHAEELREQLEVVQRALTTSQDGVSRGSTTGQVPAGVGTIVSAGLGDPDMVWLQVPDKSQNTSTIKVVVQIMAISVPNGYCPVTQTVQMFAESAFTCKNFN